MPKKALEAISGGKIIRLSQFLSELFGPCRFDCDKLISGCQRVQISENSEGFGANTKVKFL
jgi:hypothetical protein